MIMDLSCGKLRRTRLNLLFSAIHPDHGLAWTDGTCVYLAPVKINYQQVEDNLPIKLGEFESISSLHWSSQAVGCHCFLCVVHGPNVSLWRVSGSSPKLSFKQIRKIHADPIPQGCLWNPQKDILCIMNKSQCTFYFRHLDKRGSYSLPPIDSGKITCGCWSLDGRKLVVGIGSIILVYEWADIDVSINDYTIIAWKIPNIDGSICNVAALSDDRIVCSAELPLEALCSTERDMFDIPDSASSHEISLSDGGEDEIIKPRFPHKNGSLLNLSCKSKASCEDCSKLVFFALREAGKEPAKLDSINIPGILSPDLMSVDELHDIITVGSNNQNKLHVFHALSDKLEKRYIISLESDERPMGLSGVSDEVYSRQPGVLVITARAHQSDPAFLSSSTNAHNKLQLCYKTITMETDSQLRTSATAKVERFETLNLNKQSPTSSSPTACNREIKRRSIGEVFPTSSIMAEMRRSSTPAPHPVHSASSSPGSTNTIGPLEDRFRNRHTKSHANLGNFVETTNKPSLIIPGRFPAPKRDKTIVVLGESSPEKELQTETVDFKEHFSTFQNECGIQKLLFDHNVHSNGEILNKEYDSKSLAKSQKLSALVQGSATLNPDDTLNSLDNSHEKLSVKEACLNENSHTKQYTNLLKQISVLEEQLESQLSQITSLHKRVEDVTRTLKETSSIKISYKPASAPDIVYLTLRPVGVLEKSTTKAFVLDNGRLQLDSIKQAFDLKTVELIVDEIPCVLGSNVEGYIPVIFNSESTMVISGQRLVSPADQHQTGAHAGLINGHTVNGLATSAANILQPNTLVNHRQTPLKAKSSASSTFC